MAVARILCTDLAGLRAQALGLAEAAGLQTDLRTLHARRPWSWVSPSLWPDPSRAVAADAVALPLPGLVIGCGGAGARVAAALRGAGVQAVAVQHPRMAADRFDAIVAARHDGITGPNVIVTRTALHRATPARLAAEAGFWAPAFAHLPRPLVAVLLGGSNGRYRLDIATAAVLAAQLTAMMDADRVGLMLTPSRRTAPAALAVLAEALAPRGAWLWDGTGANPYYGMLGLADLIIATSDSVSMVSEAVATAAPVMLARLPGRSARIGAFMDMLAADGRVRDFAGRFELWPVAPLDDTAAAAAEMLRRLHL